METPPTTMIHSPCGSFAAGTGRTKARRRATRRNRFAMKFWSSTIYAHTVLCNWQMEGHGPGSPRRVFDRTGSVGTLSPSHVHLHSHINLAACEIFQGLAFANERDLVAAYQCLGRQRTRIVIGGHDKSIGARAHDCQ